MRRRKEERGESLWWGVNYNKKKEQQPLIPMKYFLLVCLACAVFANEVEFDLAPFNDKLALLNGMLDAHIQKQYDDIATCLQDLMTVQGDLKTLKDDITSGNIVKVISDLATDKTDFSKAIADCASVSGAKEGDNIAPIQCIKDIKDTISKVTAFIKDVKNFNISEIMKILQDGVAVEKDVEACMTDCAI